MRFVLKTAGATLLVLLVALVAVAAFFDWDAMRPQIEERLSTELGREVRIAGPLDVRLGLRPQVVANEVSIGNAPWGRAPALLEAERAHATLRLPPLLRGRLEVVEAGLEGGTLALEQNEAGEQNWDFLPERGDEDAPPGFERVLARDMAVSFDDHGRDDVWRGAIDRLAIEREEEGGPLAVSGSGQVQQRPIAVELELGGAVAGATGRASPEDRFPVSGTLQLGNQSVRINGQSGPKGQLAGGGLQVSAKGADLHADLAAFGIDIGPLPPYEASAALEIHEDRYRVHELRARLGDTQLAGQGQVALEPPSVRAELEVARLHLPDFEGLAGDGTRGEGDFLERPLPLDVLRRGEALVNVSIEQITGTTAGTALQGARATLELQNGILRLAPVRIFADKVEVEGHAMLDARAEQPRIQADLSVGRQQLSIAGQLGPQAVPAQGQYRIEAKGSELQADLAALGLEAPPLPPYQASATLALDEKELHVRELQASVGESRLAGQMAMALEPLRLRGAVNVARLHLPDFEGLGGEAAAPAQAGVPGFLEQPLPLEALRRGEARFEVRIAQITGGPVGEQLQSAQAMLELQDGVLRLAPVQVAARQAKVQGQAMLDARDEAPRLQAELTLGRQQFRLAGEMGPQAIPARGAYRVEASGRELQADLAALGLEAPEVPPYEARATVGLAEGAIRLSDLQARLGETQLAGRVLVGLQPRALEADLHLPRLHVPDLAGLGTGEAAEDANALQASLPVELLREARAVLQVRIDEITGAGAFAERVEQARVEAKLEGGVLRVSPLEAQLDGRALQAFATVDATLQRPTIEMAVQLGKHSLQLNGETGVHGALAGGTYALALKGAGPLPPYQASATLALDEKELHVRELQASVGESRLAGQMAMALEPL
ncbi:MAG TPA: AsmA family protein, partial [Burkholderiales bacterium]|nr:AsmA family protein [Burkholderiales bacterium]